MKRIKVSELVKFIKVCDLWECKSCRGGPCYFTGEFPHNCAFDGSSYIEGTLYKWGKAVPEAYATKHTKIKWRKVKLVVK